VRYECGGARVICVRLAALPLLKGKALRVDLFRG
jgi:hypothetical protein